MLRIGIIGAGHLGKIHLKLLLQLKDKFEVIGFYDTDKENAKIVNRSFRVKSFKSIELLIKEVDVIDIVSPTISHFDCASLAIRSNKHVFIEKPLAQSLSEAENLMKLSREAGVKVQVGHVERFNSAFLSAQPFIKQPLFIESHRLAEFNTRGTDVPVVLDLMIHDIDIILKLVNSSIKNVQASGVSILSDTPDIANARIEFNNGCVCNLTASRMSLKNMRKSRIFQNNAYISIDYLKKKTEIIKLRNIKPSEEIDPLAIVIDQGKGKRKKQIYFENPKTEENNAIKDEFISFANAINEDIEPEVSITDGLRALELAEVILEKMKLNNQMNVV
tara:strand:- start:1545 stop:2543 length:999 start_codon:yes stop_codon:yes gene_type:complete